jgi:hypothetical protein
MFGARLSSAGAAGFAYSETIFPMGMQTCAEKTHLKDLVLNTRMNRD